MLTSPGSIKHNMYKEEHAGFSALESWTIKYHCLGMLLKEHFLLTIKPEKSHCDDIRNKEWYISFVLKRFTLPCVLCHTVFLARKQLHRQIWTLHFPFSEMHKQKWHLPLSKQRLMLHYRQSVNMVNVCLKYDGWWVDNIKRQSLPKPEILHIQRQPAWCSRQPTADALLLDAYQRQDMASS